MQQSATAVRAFELADARLGVWLVLGSAITWSFGGMIARYLQVSDSWAIVCWRSSFASLFLLGFMLLREGLAGTRKLFASMGWPGVGMGLCVALASASFVVALSHTTVANILLMQAGAPLIAALLGWALFRERVSGPTWAAILAVILGVAVMVSASLGGQVSLLGNALAMLTMLCFTFAVLITRRFAHVRMMPAVCFGMAVAALVGGSMAGSLQVNGRDLGLLFAFGALNLGLGMAFFVSGGHKIPASFVALLGTLETVLGPVWVWLAHGEIPGARTLLGGAIVFGALLAHLLWQFNQRGADEAPRHD